MKKVRRPILLLLLAIFCASPGLLARAQTRPARTPVVFFAVERLEADVVTINPVVVIEAGKFTDLLADGNEAAAKRFEARYYKAGQKFRLLFGGGEAGTVAFKESYSEFYVCLTAKVTAETSVRLGGQVRVLATNSDTLGKSPAARRAPSPEERAAAIDAAKQAFKSRGVDEASLASISVTNLTAIDVERDGRWEMVGSFEVKDRQEIGHRLLMIFEAASAGPQAAFVWHNRGTEEDEKFESQRLVDHLDLDGDGVSEIVVSSTYYEATDYTIYKRTRGRWKEIYKGGYFGI